MMNSPSKDVKDMLVADGVSTFPDSVVLGDLPLKGPDLCAAIRTYSDQNQGTLNGSTDSTTETRVQVITRGAPGLSGYDASYEYAQEIIGALHMTVGRVQGGANYTITRLNGPSELGADERGRPLWSTNFRLWRHPV